MNLPVVLLVGCETFSEMADWDSVRVIEATTPDEALRHLDQVTVSVLVLGPRLHPEEMRALLERSIAEHEGASRVNILSGIGADTEPFQALVDQDRIFYLSRSPLTNADLRAMILAGAGSSARQEQAGALLTSEMTDRSLEFCVRICLQTDSAGAARLLAETVREELAADATQCFFYDRVNQALTSTHTEPRVETAAAGLSGYVARTGLSIRVERAGDDCRYDAQSDNPGGQRDARFLAEPVFARTDVIIAVVTATRSRAAEPFSPEDTYRAAALAGWAAPSLTALLIHESAQVMMLDRARSAGPELGIFRLEALESYTGSGHEQGDVLEAAPAWLRRTHWVTIALLMISLIYMILTRVDETATGPALVCARSKSAVTSMMGGLVLSVEVAKGDHIRSGDLLVQLDDSPGVTGLKPVERQLRAPKDGLVSDVRVRPGQQIRPGDHVASIIDESAGYELIAAIPKSYQPKIQPGMSIVFRLTRHPDSREIVTIDRIGTETGRENSEAMGFTGPVVTVHSTLPREITAGGRSYAYEDGMTGYGEVRVSSEPLIIKLIPRLKDLVATRK